MVKNVFYHRSKTNKHEVINYNYFKFYLERAKTTLDLMIIKK